MKHLENVTVPGLKFVEEEKMEDQPHGVLPVKGFIELRTLKERNSLFSLTESQD